MNRLSIKLVDQVILSWSIRFKGSGKTPAELKLLVREYHEDLLAENFTDKSFVSAAKYARRKCTFFPTIPDLVSARAEVRRVEERRKALKQLPDPDLTHEEIEENLRRVREIIESVQN